MRPHAPSFAGWPIRYKLVAIILGITVFALLVSAILTTELSVSTERRALMQRLDTTADILALQSRPALQFLDPTAARENLQSLSADPSIRLACIYDDTGGVFASYQPQAGAIPCRRRRTWPRNSSGTGWRCSSRSPSITATSAPSTSNTTSRGCSTGCAPRPSPSWAS
ncbi:MAG: CHASE sensor domain-containing protein [Alphaproteobacteria bacterium]